MRMATLLAALAIIAGGQTAWTSEAGAFARLRYRIHGKWIAFVRDANEHLTLSAGCAPKKDCDAYRALAQSSPDSLAGLDAFRKGGAETGAIICRQTLHAQVVLGRDDAGNETGFCGFKDGSFVGTGSLAYRASIAARAKEGP